jgi:signal transduction histidine kinase
MQGVLRMSDAPGAALRPALLVLAMAGAIAFVAALAYWDARRESAVSLEAFAAEQTAVATAAGAALPLRIRGGATEDAVAALTSELRAVEQPGNVVALTRAPHGAAGWRMTNGALIADAAIDAAFDRGAPWVLLPRDSAMRLGLPQRSAVAGLRRIEDGAGGVWGVAVVASARGERDRAASAQRRLLLSVGVACGLVLVFGGIALRVQRKKLELSRELAIAAVRRDRDDRLQRADKLATMGALATGIAHEVATPLGVILGRAEQLEPRVAADERARRAVEIIVQQSERIRSIIRGFLTLARGGSPSLVHVAPQAIALAAVRLVEHRFAAARVGLETSIAPDLPAIASEPRLFEQALVNLLLNACDACDAGGRVELHVRSDEEHVVFVVIDDGVGISSEVAARAVEPFFTTKPDGLGTGLGLAIATEIVKHHQGRLEIEASGGAKHGGTRVCIEVPAVREEA